MEICNIVSSYSIPVKVDIEYIRKELSPISDRVKDFPSVNLRLKKSSLCPIFRNGKMIIIGGRTVAENNSLFQDYVQLLRHLGYGFTADTPIVQNIIARYEHSTSINLLKFAQKAGSVVTYEPELFPAVRYRLEEYKTTVNIFHTGRCMILGAKSTVLLQVTTERLALLLKCCQ